MEVEKQPFLVQAQFSFKGKNNDELQFKKGDIITVTQFEEGGWWEGTLDEKTGWFPSNYVKEYKVDGIGFCLSENLSPVKTPVAQQRAYRGVVLKDFIDSERGNVAELQSVISTYLHPLEKSKILPRDEYQHLYGNLKEVLSVYENLLNGLEKAWDKQSADQRVGKLLLTTAPKIKQSLHTYCSRHPKAVAIIEKHKEELGIALEGVGKGVLGLTAGLSKPFRRIEKICGHLQELERHMEESHVDRGDTQRAVSVYKDIQSWCAKIRRQKELELEILTGGVRGWEGQDLSTLGDILHMGSVAVGPEHTDRYFVLFPTTLLILSVSHRMSAFIYEGKLPLTGITLTKLEDNETYKNAFEISGTLIEKIVAVCQTKEDQQAWIDILNQQCKKIGLKSSPFHLPINTSHTDELLGPNTWSITRLRPSPPMKSCLLKSEKPQILPKNSEHFEEDAQILQVIEAYCSSSKYNVNSDNITNEIIGRLSKNPELKHQDRSYVVQLVKDLQEQISSLCTKLMALSQDVNEEKLERLKLQNIVDSLIENNKKII